MNRSVKNEKSGYISPDCQVNVMEVEQGLCVASNEGFGVQPLGFDPEEDPTNGLMNY